MPAGGEERPGQVEMAATVARAPSRTGTHLLVQAGTGTGKSLAYLVPAASSGRTVVVATATKALQDQLATKDLPLVAAGDRRPVLVGRPQGTLELPLPPAGRELADGGDQQRSSTEARRRGPKSPTRPARRARAGWPTSCGGSCGGAGQTTTGDRAELPFEPSARAWSMVSVGPRECPGAFRCPSGNHCFAEAARDEAEAADVVVVNTHLYGAHLAAGGRCCPPHDVVVFDEAHALEEVMTASLGVELTPGRFRALGDGVSGPRCRRRTPGSPTAWSRSPSGCSALARPTSAPGCARRHSRAADRA